MQLTDFVQLYVQNSKTEQIKYKADIFLPISIQIIIRGPNGGLSFVI